MSNRRSFLRTAGAAGAAMVLAPSRTFAYPRESRAAYFGLHQFIESNPDAVFIMSTNVDVKTNSAAKLAAGRTFADSVLVSRDTPGIPVGNNVVFKPNLTCRARSHSAYTIERSMGIQTDVYFVEGMVDRLLELGVAASKVFVREVNCPEDFADAGYLALASRKGIDIANVSAPVGTIPESKLVWKEVANGTWFKRIPYVWPVGAPDSWLVNVSKLKAHSMGITLCAKNLQGTIASPYVSHCKKFNVSMGIATADYYANAFAVIQGNWQRRVNAGLPRWDRPEPTGGLWQETWASRCLDNNSTLKAGLHVIEGIYGRDGNFMDGPSPDGLATDYMSNVIIFGLNPFHVDTIGTWIAGHEPGNFGLFHIAKERGLSSILNPSSIPLYEWTGSGIATKKQLTAFSRTPLKTLYLRKDYSGGTEDLYHMVDEPYTYPTGVREEPLLPDQFLLRPNYPNPFNGTTSIEFSLPGAGELHLEVLDLFGQTVTVLARGKYLPGVHLVRWDASGVASGTYFCRLQFAGWTKVRSMTVLR